MENRSIYISWMESLIVAARRKKSSFKVLILDDITEIRSNIRYLICFKHLISAKAVTNWIFFYPERSILPHAYAT